MSDSILDRANKGILGLNPYEPGKPIEETQKELGIQNIIKLASNENPLGISPVSYTHLTLPTTSKV